eukprot:363283-Chlamydomonas_euryale.AAC.2
MHPWLVRGPTTAPNQPSGGRSTWTSTPNASRAPLHERQHNMKGGARPASYLRPGRRPVFGRWQSTWWHCWCKGLCVWRVGVQNKRWVGARQHYPAALARLPKPPPRTLAPAAHAARCSFSGRRGPERRRDGSGGSQRPRYGCSHRGT